MSCVATARYNVSLISVDLPEPDTPVTQVISPSGNSAVTFLRLLAVAPMTRSMRFGSGDAPHGRYRDAPPAAQVLTGDGVGMRRDFRGVPCATILPPCTPAPGTQIDHVVGLADGVLVVLDHDDGVAEIAQIDQRVEQALVVALMQANRGLVENVHDADQAGADLAGETDALRLAARQRVGAAVQA